MHLCILCGFSGFRRLHTGNVSWKIQFVQLHLQYFAKVLSHASFLYALPRGCQIGAVIYWIESKHTWKCRTQGKTDIVQFFLLFGLLVISLSSIFKMYLSRSLIHLFILPKFCSLCFWGATIYGRWAVFDDTAHLPWIVFKPFYKSTAVAWRIS